jgi:protein-S-isoprenylcysteine O-methyltransferase Ste14
MISLGETTSMVKVPPPIWTLLCVLAAAALSALAGWPRFPGLPIVPLGVVLVTAGVALPPWAGALFWRAGATLIPQATDHKRLVVDGPYRFTRNPMYLGLTLVTLGIAVSNGAWPMLLAPIALVVTFNFVHIPYEEAAMRREFGADFDDYARRVRRWI